MGDVAGVAGRGRELNQTKQAIAISATAKIAIFWVILSFFPDAESSSVAGLGFEFVGPLPARWSEAQPIGIAGKFKDPVYQGSFMRTCLEDVVDRFGIGR